MAGGGLEVAQVMGADCFWTVATLAQVSDFWPSVVTHGRIVRTMLADHLDFNLGYLGIGGCGGCPKDFPCNRESVQLLRGMVLPD